MAHDDDLIERYIDPASRRRGAAEARIAGAGVHVWALVGAWLDEGEDAGQVAADYGLPREAVEAALAYYDRHRAVIDAQLTLHAAAVAPAS
jgi:uncharacterized protein (DUF433 family)